MLGEADLDVLIRTGLNNAIAIGLAKSLSQDRNPVLLHGSEYRGSPGERKFSRLVERSRVPQESAADAREILHNVEVMK